MADNFCCSIELEPKTLKEGQLNQAREVAVDIVQNEEPTEASTLFTEGLKPVIASKEGALMVQEADQLHKENQCNIQTSIIETTCQCLCTSAVIDSPADQSKLKEPLSAPF